MLDSPTGPLVMLLTGVKVVPLVLEVVLVKRGPVIELKTGLLVVAGMPLELVAGVLPVMVSRLPRLGALLDVPLETLLPALLEALEVPTELDVPVELKMPVELDVPS